MAESMDPRTLRVRKALSSAVRELLAERPAEDLSVTEVAAVAGVSRPTVYQHFGDMTALVASATQDFLEELFASIDEVLPREDSLENVERRLELFVGGVYENRVFSRNALHSQSAFAIVFRTQRYLEELMIRYVMGGRLGGSERAASDRLSAISAGLVWMVVTWLDSDFSGDNEPGVFASRLVGTLFDLAGVDADD